MGYTYLAHHGILGMKWGVRRYQNPDGSLTPEGRQRYGRDAGAHKISKGTMVYRASVNPGEAKSNMYVTYTQADRALYKGSYGQNALTKNQGGKKLYETSYELTKDLNLPSKDLVRKIINEEMTNDPKFRKQASAAQAGAWFMKQMFAESYSESEQYQKAWLDYEEGKISEQKLDEIWKKGVSDEGKKWTNAHLKQYSNMSYDEIFREGSQSFGPSDYNKQKVINRLRQMGYNAMVDEAGVGFGGGSRKEGVEPLIVFDSSAFKVRGSSYIDPSSASKYDQEYYRWKNTAKY